MVISEKKGQVDVQEFLLQFFFFFLQMSASVFMHCVTKEEAKDDICMIEVVICLLV